MKTKYTIAGESFPTKAAIRDRCQQLCKRWYENGEGKVSEGDARFLHEFLSQYLDTYPIRFSAGVECFYVVQNRRNRKALELEAVDTDGVRDSVSWYEAYKAVGGGAEYWPKKHRKDFKNTLRDEVKNQTEGFKRDQFASGPVSCAITGEALLHISADVHVDHGPDLSFDQLAEGFIAKHALTQDDFRQTQKLKGGGWQLVDRDLACCWKDHHRQHAKLRITKAVANLRRKRS